MPNVLSFTRRTSFQVFLLTYLDDLLTLIYATLKTCLLVERIGK